MCSCGLTGRGRTGVEARKHTGQGPASQASQAGVALEDVLLLCVSLPSRG